MEDCDGQGPEDLGVLRELYNQDELYRNIYDPEEAEKAISKAKLLEEENVKLKSQNVEMKRQIGILFQKQRDLLSNIDRKNIKLAKCRRELESFFSKRSFENMTKIHKKRKEEKKSLKKSLKR